MYCTPLTIQSCAAFRNSAIQFSDSETRRFGAACDSNEIPLAIQTACPKRGDGKVVALVTKREQFNDKDVLVV